MIVGCCLSSIKKQNKQIDRYGHIQALPLTFVDYTNTRAFGCSIYHDMWPKLKPPDSVVYDLF